MATAASAVPGGSVDLALEGCTVIVTGAGSGIGAATARLLGAAGASVVLVGRRETPLRQSAGAVEQAGGRAVPVPADLADRASPARIIAAALAAFGRIDGLVNTRLCASTGRCPSGRPADSRAGRDEYPGALLPHPGRAAGPAGVCDLLGGQHQLFLGHLAAVRPVRVRHDQVRPGLPDPVAGRGTGPAASGSTASRPARPIRRSTPPGPTISMRPTGG